MIKQVRHGDNAVEFQRNGWTLAIYTGREVGTLPMAAPTMTIYKAEFDERKQTIFSRDIRTPHDPDFTLALVEMFK